MHLCETCNGNGVLKIRGGIQVCRSCEGRGSFEGLPLSMKHRPAEWLRQLLARQPNVVSASLITCGGDQYGVEVTTECGAEYMATLTRTR